MSKRDMMLSKKELDKNIKGFFDDCTYCTDLKSEDTYSLRKLVPILKEYLVEKMGFVDRKDRTLEDLLFDFRKGKLKEENYSYLNINSLGKDYEAKADNRKNTNMIEEDNEEMEKAFEEYYKSEQEQEILKMAEELEKIIEKDYSLSSGNTTKDSNFGAKLNSVDNQLNSVDWFAYIESNREWVKNYVLSIDSYIKRIMSNLSYYKLNEGLLISINQDFLKLLEDKQEHTKTLLNDLEMIMVMLEDGTCFDDNGYLPLSDYKDEMEDIIFPKEKKEDKEKW